MVETILAQLIYNSSYFVRVWPYMNEEYFEKGPAQTLFKEIKSHIDNYNNVPTTTALNIALDKSTVSETELDGAKSLLKGLQNTPEDFDWLVDNTEKYVQEKAMYNATSRIIEIQGNAQLPKGKRDKNIPDVGAIPEIMQQALAISFDSDIGHDWFDDYEKRWLLYRSKANKIAFNLPILNLITKGGAERGTLNIIMAGVNVGKSLGLCSLAADYLTTGNNVLYISMEMAEHVCAKRIDANLLDVSLDDIDDGNISYAEYKARMERFNKKNTAGGRLIIKQYPTSGANANTFRALLNELKLKKNFVPDVIIVDYLGICASTRVRNSDNSYTLVKSIAEELRGLAVESNTIMWSGAQTQRASWTASDMTMGDVAESAGLPATADFMLGAIEVDELAEQGCQLLIQIKSRYGDKNKNKHITIGVKKGNQRWYETDATAKAGQKVLNEVAGDMIKEKEENNRAKLDELAETLKFE
ncbi:DnaB-like replicative helicase [Serratia phage 92A1]|nr:DnaB-like replicative helicase [Serratia phage 92A1]